MRIAKLLRLNVFAMIVFLASMLVFVPNVFAAEAKGRDTAIKKLWYAAWATCMGEDHADLAGWYNTKKNPTQDQSTGYIEGKRLKMGEWFDSYGNHPFAALFETKKIAPGAYIDKLVFGQYKDKMYYCGENHNAMAKKFWSSKPLNFESPKEIVCGFEGSGYVSGIWMITDYEQTTCERKYEDDFAEWYIDNLYGNFREVFDSMVTAKAFNNRKVDLWKFTDNENYWVSRLTFEAVCVKGDPIYDGGDHLKYQVVLFDTNTRKFRHAGYEPNKNEDTNVYYYHYKKKTCKQLAADINPGSSYFNAYKDDINEPIKRDCQALHDEILDNMLGEYIREYWQTYMYGYNLADAIGDLLGFVESDDPDAVLVPLVGMGKETEKVKLSSPLKDSYISYIDEQLSQVINAKINGEAVFKETAFNHLAETAKSVLSHIDFDEVMSSDGDAVAYATLKSKDAMADEKIALVQGWYDEVEKQLDTIRENYNTLIEFRTSHNNDVAWAYVDDEETNIECLTETGLEADWNEIKDGLPGAPDVDGSFDPDEHFEYEEPPLDDGADVNCVNSGAAESLGWIVCPILEWMTDASKDMYEKYIVPALQIKPKLFDKRGGDNNDVEDAWRIFQNIANIMFVILFMVVIFSQLTGYGIDNYGIKKILPKLIIVAILVNLSYYICLICVDLSNIAGNGLQSIFDGMAGSMHIPDIYRPDGTSVAAASTATNITAVVLLGMLALVGVAVWQNPAILLALLVSALGVIIAIFFLFILLSAREAAIMVLTVISPVAFICYMLPNTKKLFDKWLKFGEGLLLVYPICGLLIGGGNFASKLLLVAGAGSEENGFFQAFTAMLVGIVPIFFIPTVLKGAFAAMGSIGAKLSGFGDRARIGATSRIRRSAGFKAAQARGLERKSRIIGGLDADGNAKKIGAFGRLMRGGKRNMARSRAQYLRDQDTRGREENLMGVGYEAARVGQAKKAEAEETANYMTLINDKTRNGEDEDALLKMYDQYMDEGNKAGAVAVARIAGRRKDTAASFLSKRVTGRGLETKEEKEKLLAGNSAHSEIFRSVAKEISTGENSRTYRESSPLGFEFAAQYNRNGSDIDYTDWGGSSENIERAVDNYVTDSQQLVGAKNSSLEEIAEKIEDGTLDAAHVTRLRNLARETIQNRATTGVWDSTKAENIYRIAGMEMPADAIDDGGKATSAHTPPVATNGADTVAKEGETFSTRGGAETGPKIMVDYTPDLEQARRAMHEFEAEQIAKGNSKWPGNKRA